MAHALLKNPYNFDCLGLHEEAAEREIEHASIKHITKFLLELGNGFAFIGNRPEIITSHSEHLRLLWLTAFDYQIWRSLNLRL